MEAIVIADKKENWQLQPNSSDDRMQQRTKDPHWIGHKAQNCTYPGSADIDETERIDKSCRKGRYVCTILEVNTTIISKNN